VAIKQNQFCSYHDTRDTDNVPQQPPKDSCHVCTITEDIYSVSSLNYCKCCTSDIFRHPCSDLHHVMEPHGSV